jgi:hypothetical protein
MLELVDNPFKSKAVLLAGGTALVVAFRYRLSKPTVYIRGSAQNTEREIEQ